MINKLLLISALLLPCWALAEAPEYFDQQIDEEYRAFIQHIRETLPQTNLPLAYLASFTPYNLLDVRPTKIKNVEDKQSFTNFNFGVFGNALLNVEHKLLTHLPGMILCTESACQTERIEMIQQFLLAIAPELVRFQQNADLFIVQQTSPDVYRINNTFFSPPQLITYFPSAHAGFVPSANFETYSPNDAPDLVALATYTQSLRNIMSEYTVAAITKVHNGSVDIVFAGLGDNHWGVVLNHPSQQPTSGDYNHIGLEYEVVQPISADRFYYQTN